MFHSLRWRMVLRGHVRQPREVGMGDVIYVLVGLVFFGVCWGACKLFAGLMGGDARAKGGLP